LVVVASGFFGTNFCRFSTKNGGNVEKLGFIKYKILHNFVILLGKNAKFLISQNS
jgi:hypothetical protein